MPGEAVRLTDPKGRSHLITLREGASFHTHRGTLSHDDIIGGPDGNVVRSGGGTPTWSSGRCWPTSRRPPSAARRWCAPRTRRRSWRSPTILAWPTSTGLSWTCSPAGHCTRVKCLPLQGPEPVICGYLPAALGDA